jgi:hypothetical protein
MHPFRRPEQYAASRSKLRIAGRHRARFSSSLLRVLVGFGLVFGIPASQRLAAQSPTLGALHVRRQGSPAVHSPAQSQGILLLENMETGVTRRFLLRRPTLTLEQLAPGPYRVSFEPALAGASGAAAVAPALVLDLHADSMVDLVLDSAQQLRLDAGVAASSVVDGVHQPADQAVAAPAIAADQDADGLPSAHGLPDYVNSTEIDGVSATQRFQGVPLGSGADPAPDPDGDPDSADRTSGPAHGLALGRHAGIAYLFSEAATREFRVQSAGYSAQTANAGGAEVNLVSRSGTRTFHGEAFFLLRSSALAATDPDSFATSYANGVVSGAEVKPHDLRDRFGLSLGGPVATRLASSHRLFFLAVYDGQRRGFPAISSPVDPNFYNLTANQRALLANRGLSTAQIDAGLSYLSSLTGSVDRRSDQDLVFGRLDWLEHPRLTLGLQTNLVRWNAPAGLENAPVIARGRASVGNATGELAAVLLRVDSRFNARTANSFRLQFLHDAQYETPQTRLPQEPGVAPGGAAPGVTIGPNGLLFGTPPSLVAGVLPDERRLQLAETLSLVRGRHSLAVGGGISFIHDQSSTSENTAGSFHYDNASPTAPGGLADFLTDYTYNVNMSPNGACPSIFAKAHLFCFQSFTQSFGQSSAAFSTTDFAAFAEDTWRPYARLSLHLGVRYEYTLLPIPEAPNPTLDAIFGAQGASSIFPEDRNNFGPRAAAAYEPFGAGRGTVRVGYGVFFGRLPGATLLAPLTQTALASSVSRLRITPSAEVPCNNASTQGFGYPCAFAVEPAGAASQTTSAVVFDRRFRLPMIQQGSLTLERSFGGERTRTTLTAGYLLNLDRQLPGSTDLNIAASTSSAIFQLQGGTGSAGVRDGELFTLPVYTARVSPGFGPVTDLVSHSNGVYHGLVLTADSRAGLRFLRGLGAHVDYTWSKAIDDAPDLSATPRTDSQLDPRANGYDKGLSSLNYPWIAHARLLWQPGAEATSSLLRGLGRGWSVAAIVNARAGRPYSLNTSGGTYLAGGHTSLDGSGGALYLPTVGRNTLRLPATSTTNLRITKSIPAGRVHVDASAEVSNVFNRRNISSVNARAFLRGTPVGGMTPLVFQSSAAIAAEGLNTTPFGTPTASASDEARARQVQFGLRVAF